MMKNYFEGYKVKNNADLLNGIKLHIKITNIITLLEYRIFTTISVSASKSHDKCSHYDTILMILIF